MRLADIKVGMRVGVHPTGSWRNCTPVEVEVVDVDGLQVRSGHDHSIDPWSVTVTVDGRDVEVRDVRRSHRPNGVIVRHADGRLQAVHAKCVRGEWEWVQAECAKARAKNRAGMDAMISQAEEIRAQFAASIEGLDVEAVLHCNRVHMTIDAFERLAARAKRRVITDAPGLRAFAAEVIAAGREGVAVVIDRDKDAWTITPNHEAAFMSSCDAGWIVHPTQPDLPGIDDLDDDDIATMAPFTVLLAPGEA